jgi:hypothetical protein
MHAPHAPAVKTALREAAKDFKVDTRELCVTEIARIKRQRSGERFYRVRIENMVGTTRFYYVTLDGSRLE